MLLGRLLSIIKIGLQLYALVHGLLQHVRGDGAGIVRRKSTLRRQARISAKTAAGHQLIIGILRVEAAADARLQDLVSRVARLRLARIHHILLELQLVIVLHRIGILVLLQWDLLLVLLL